MMCQCRFISHSKCLTQVRDVDNGGGCCACVRPRSTLGDPVPSPQFCCEPSTALKIQSLKKETYLFLNLFYWSIFDLQCCVNFYCTAKWFSYTHIYILFHILFYYSLSQDIEYSSLCWTVGHCCLSILYIIVCILLISNSQSIPPPPLPLGNHKSVLFVSLFLFCR